MVADTQNAVAPGTREVADLIRVNYPTLRSWYANGWIPSDSRGLWRRHDNPCEVVRLALMADFVNFAGLHPKSAYTVAFLSYPVSEAEFAEHTKLTRYAALGFYEDGTFAVWWGQNLSSQHDPEKWHGRQGINEDGSIRGVRGKQAEVPQRIFTRDVASIVNKVGLRFAGVEPEE